MLFLSSFFLEQPHLGSSYFLQNSYFFIAKLLPSRHFLRTGSSLKHVPFGTATVFVELFKIKIDIYRKCTFSKQVLLHSINFFRRATFWKKLFFHKSNILHYPLFLESYLFREAILPKSVVFYSIYLFRRVTFSQLTFSGELLFPSYASLPQLHFLLISY